MTSHDNGLEEALTSLGLARFAPPPPKPGGLVHVFQILDERSRARLAELSEDYSGPGAVDFGFAEHREFNAFAQRGEKDVICLYSAAVRAMWSLCNAVMTIRELFPWIDDVERLGETSAPPAKGELFYIQQKSAASEEIEPIRRKLAAALFDVAMDFALMHEIGHLWNGHVDLLHQAVGPAPLQEMHFVEANGLGLAEAQALEFDADFLRRAKGIRPSLPRKPVQRVFGRLAEGPSGSARWRAHRVLVFHLVRHLRTVPPVRRSPRCRRRSNLAAAAGGASASLPLVHRGGRLQSAGVVEARDAGLGGPGDQRRA